MVGNLVNLCVLVKKKKVTFSLIHVDKIFSIGSGQTPHIVSKRFTSFSMQFGSEMIMQSVFWLCQSRVQKNAPFAFDIALHSTVTVFQPLGVFFHMLNTMSSLCASGYHKAEYFLQFTCLKVSCLVTKITCPDKSLYH